MTKQAFIDAVSEMKGLLPPMIEELIALADVLTPEEREETAENLHMLNERIGKNQEEAVEIYEEGMETVEEINTEVLPEMRKVQEEDENAALLEEVEEDIDQL